MIGNLLPDMTTGPTPHGLHPEVLAGANLHRRIDAYTDTHPIFAQSRSRFQDRHGRFGGILTDMFYDHILARDWHRYYDPPLPAFIDHAHDQLIRHQDLMPEPMRPIIRRMVDQGWLRCYASAEGMAVILGMMSRRFTERLRRPINLAIAVQDLPAIDAELTEDFHTFFPQLIAFVQSEPDTPRTHTPASDILTPAARASSTPH